jgi:hypothetical protein
MLTPTPAQPQERLQAILELLCLLSVVGALLLAMLLGMPRVLRGSIRRRAGWCFIGLLFGALALASLDSLASPRDFGTGPSGPTLLDRLRAWLGW